MLFSRRMQSSKKKPCELGFGKKAEIIFLFVQFKLHKLNLVCCILYLKEQRCSGEKLILLSDVEIITKWRYSFDFFGRAAEAPEPNHCNKAVVNLGRYLIGQENNSK